MNLLETVIPLVGMSERMKKKFSKHWEDKEDLNNLLFIALILDPHYKVKFISFLLLGDLCSNKDNGALRLQNNALLLKQLHKFYNKDDVPWVRLVWDKYYNGKVPRACRETSSFLW